MAVGLLAVRHSLCRDITRFVVLSFHPAPCTHWRPVVRQGRRVLLMSLIVVPYLQFILLVRYSRLVVPNVDFFLECTFFWCPALLAVLWIATKPSTTPFSTESHSDPASLKQRSEFFWPRKKLHGERDGDPDFSARWDIAAAFRLKAGRRMRPLSVFQSVGATAAFAIACPCCDRGLATPASGTITNDRGFKLAACMLAAIAVHVVIFVGTDAGLRAANASEVPRAGCRLGGMVAPVLLRLRLRGPHREGPLPDFAFEYPVLSFPLFLIPRLLVSDFESYRLRSWRRCSSSMLRRSS